MRFDDQEYTDFLYEVVRNEKRHDLYQKTCECAKNMRIHIYGDTPTDILNRVRPREPDEIKKYRAENYECTTKATASRALSVVGKIFNPLLSQIKWKEQTKGGEVLEKYMLEDYPKYNSVIKFLSQAGLKRMIADPNGVFAIRPREIPQDQTKTLEPEVKTFGSSSIYFYDQDHFLIFIKKEKSEKAGEIFFFEYYDKQFVIDFSVEIINSKTVVIEESLRYPHNFGEVPVWFLTGETETEDNGMEYYISFFEPALPFWNKAITHESDLDAAFINHLHPQKVVTAEDCDFVQNNQRCQHGKILYPDGTSVTCPSCHGAGKRVPIGPYGVHLVPKEKLEFGQQMNTPVQYVTVPTEPTEMLKERVDEQHKKGLAALNMDVLDKVGENQSGIAKVIDRGELYDFLYKISDVIFDTHLQNFFYFFNLYMNGVQSQGKELNKNLPEISKPAIFDLSTTHEQTMEYSEAKKATLNAEYLRQKSISIAAKEYASTPDVKRKIVTILELDPLPEIAPADLELKLAIGTVSRKDAVIHDNIGAFVDRAVQENKNFWDIPKKEKMEVLHKYAEEFLTENQVTLDQPDDTEGAGAEA
jgi:hypothetical protein